MLLLGEGELAATLAIGSQLREELMRTSIREAAINDEMRVCEGVLGGMIAGLCVNHGLGHMSLMLLQSESHNN